MNRWPSVLVGIALAAYPFLAYWGLTRFSPRRMALALLLVFVARYLLLRRHNAALLKSFTPLFLSVGTSFLLGIILNRDRYLLFVPGLVNLSTLVAFASTLAKPPSMIERFARLRHPDLTPDAIAYCRSVTKVWCAFFVCNGLVALATALGPSLSLWALYNGFISYLLIGSLFLVEFAVRRVRMKAAMRAPDAPIIHSS